VELVIVSQIPAATAQRLAPARVRAGIPPAPEAVERGAAFSARFFRLSTFDF
jgi:hypothetical protein